MTLDGIHHVTCITGDAPRNVDFYTRVLGLRLVKKTVNQDDPTVYHLFYADEAGTPGSDITFFEYPGVRRGRAGAGMVHTVQWRVASDAALDFWEGRLAAEADDVARNDAGLAFEDPEGLRHRLVVSSVDDAPLIAEHPEVPAEHALQGFDARTRLLGAARAQPCAARGDARLRAARSRHLGGARPVARRPLRLRRAARRTRPRRRRHGAPRRLVDATRRAGRLARARRRSRHAPVAGHRPLLVPLDLLPRAERRPLRDRDPWPGLLARRGSGAPGRALILPPAFEHLRAQIEPALTPIPDPRPWVATR